MQIEVLSPNTPKDFEDIFRREVENIHPIIKRMLQERNVTFKLVDCISELVGEERTQKIEDAYNYDISLKNQSRGLLSDESHCIALSVKNTSIDNIGAILYHELGHFLDIYENYGKIETLADLIFSSDKRFMDAYQKDFAQNYHLIINDDNFRLKHFIQEGTPDNINQNAVSETFAELFRVVNNKQNDTKTVELYFSRALNVLKTMLNEKYYLTF